MKVERPLNKGACGDPFASKETITTKGKQTGDKAHEHPDSAKTKEEVETS